jgi:hypothetical protein
VTQRHAEATTIEDMQRIILLLLLKHGMMRAFLSSGYCLWTQYGFLRLDAFLTH